jgi:hypothetical protein
MAPFTLIIGRRQKVRSGRTRPRIAIVGGTGQFGRAPGTVTCKALAASSR